MAPSPEDNALLSLAEVTAMDCLDFIRDLRLYSCSISLVMTSLILSIFCIELTLESLKLVSCLYLMMSLKNPPSISSAVLDRLDGSELTSSSAKALESPR